MNISCKKNLLKWSIFGLILALAIGLRVYHQSKKNDLFIDEYLSYMISTVNPFWSEKDYTETSAIHSNDLHEQYMNVDPSLQSLIKQIVSLRKDTRDAPHPNLYYSMLRLSLYGVNNNNYDEMILRGFILNLVFFFISFVVFFKLSSKLFNNNIPILCALAITFLNPASVANTIFLRPYEMQEMIFILFTYVTVIYCLKIQNHIVFNKYKFCFLYGLVIAITLLIGYFSVLYVILLLFVLFLYMNKYSDNNNKWLLLVSSILSIIFAEIIYPRYLRGFSTYRGKESLSNLKGDSFFENLKNSYNGLIGIFHEYYWDAITFSLFFLIVVLIFFLKIKSKNKLQLKQVKLPLILFVCALIWLLGVIYVAPYKTIRYILPILPIFGLILPILLAFLSRKHQILFSILFNAYLIYKSFSCVNIYIDQIPINPFFSEKRKTPLIIMSARSWEQTQIIPFYKDSNRTVEFSFDSINYYKKMNQYNELFLFIPTDSISKYPVPSNYEIDKELTENKDLKMYYLKRKPNTETAIVSDSITHQ